MVPYFESLGYKFPLNYNPWDYVLHLLVSPLVASSAYQTGDERSDSAPDESLARSRESARDHLVRIWKGSESSTSTRSPDESEEGHFLAEPSEGYAREVHSRGPKRALAKRANEVLGRSKNDDLPQKYRRCFRAQFWGLARRSLIQKRGNLFDRIALLQLVITTSTSIFWWRLGPTERYLDDRVGSFAFFTAFWSFTGSLISLHTFPAEKAVLNKDRATGLYRLSAYYLSKMFVELPLDLLYPLMFSLVSYFVIGLTLSVRQFFVFWTFIALASMSASSVGLMFSAIFLNHRWAQVSSTGFLLWSMQLGGYYSNSFNQPSWLRSLRFLSTIRYAFEALVRNEVQGRTYACETDPQFASAYSQGGRICPVNETSALDAAQVDGFSILGCAGMLLVLVVVARVIGYLALKHIHTRHKLSASSIMKCSS